MRLALRFVWLKSLLAVVFTLALTRGAAAQATQPSPSDGDHPSPAKVDVERQHAFDLYKAGKMVEAMPLFEKLCAENPKDSALFEAWGVATLNYSQTLESAEMRKKARIRARATLIKARDLGDNSNLLQVLLSMIPEDGGDNTFSPRKEVNDAMQKAEADFARGDLEKAKDGYMQAGLLDPRLYEAPLFVGDVFFKQHHPGSAAEWFAHAAELDPNRETAFRYWGDALWEMDNSDGAREKYIRAVIAEPYTRQSWVGLTQWSAANKVQLNWVRLRDRSNVTKKDDKNINITVNAAKGETADLNTVAWTAYGLSRALWNGEKFKKEFPKEPKYRRTLREESDSLHRMVAVLLEQKDFEKRKDELDPGLQQLVKADQAGFLEPFALLNRADPEIGQDYAPYRAQHRQLIYRYFDEFVVPKTPAPKSH